jgi:signal transduction histidine kinase
MIRYKSAWRRKVPGGVAQSIARVAGLFPSISDRVLVGVQDSGIGIERQNLEKIFDPFYTTKSQAMGMG